MQQERKIPFLVPWTGGDKASNADFILRRSHHHNPLNPLNPLNLLNLSFPVYLYLPFCDTINQL
jgi:hypothetical protein